MSARRFGRPAPLVVVGDVLLDRDLRGAARRLAPDAPVPVVEDVRATARPGGAGLAALLCARSTSRPVVLVCALGGEAGDEARTLLAAEGIEVVDLGLDGGGTTPEKIRIHGGGRPIARLDLGEPGAAGAVTAAAVSAVAQAGAVLVSDYGRGMTALSALRDAIAVLPASVPVVWDPHPGGVEPVAGATLVTPNAGEAACFAAAAVPGGPAAAGDAAGTASDAGAGALPVSDQHARALRRAWRAVGVCVTRGGAGALLVTGDGPCLAVPAAPAGPGADPCGAGDCFAATAAARLADGALPSEAVTAAVTAASAFVAGGGAGALAARSTTPRPAVGPVSRRPPSLAAPPVAADAIAVAARVRAGGGTVVATGGCFDLLHAGHVRALQAARALGDCLLVCLNSDASVRRLKGPDRPLVPAADRAAVLAALGCVDGVLVFEQDTPAEALRVLRPHLFAKGGDYAAGELPEAAVVAEWGGRAVIVPYVQGRSTSRLIEEARLRVP